MGKSKGMCSGCRDDYYNRPGNSQDGECWMYKTARVVSRTSVGTWQPPPYRWIPQKTLSCHHQVGLHWIDKDDCRVVREKKGA